MASFKFLLSSFPTLAARLRLANMKDKPEVYLQKAIMSSAMLSVVIGLGGAMLAQRYRFPVIFPLSIGFFVFFWAFLNFLKTPDMVLLKQKREIEKEIIFAGRFMVIELESGVPLYDTIENTARNYPTIGAYLNQIVDRVRLGIALEDAINQSVDETSSENFRKMLWQILNSLKTGADISISLEAAVEQITKEQLIEVADYGKKLNPLAMFYMIIAVVLPSIGVVMMIIFASFLSISLKLPVLMVIVLFTSIMQYMFLSVMQTQRPAVAV